MSFRLYKTWRLIATGLGFSVFGVGVVLLGAYIFLFIYLPPWAKERKQKRVRQVIHWACGRYVELLHRLGLITYDYHCTERFLKAPRLIVANHPSLIDVLILLSLVPDASCIIKAEMMRSRIIAGIASLAGYIPNDDASLVARAMAVLDSGRSLIVFPEGTRTVPGKKMSLRRGAANIAVRARCVITPVLIRFDPVALLKEQRWYDIPDRRIHIVVRAMPALTIEECIDVARPMTVQARHLTAFFANYFDTELKTL